MKIFLKNTLHGLIPLYNSDLEEKKKLKLNEVYVAEVKRPRNYQFHKKFFALLNLAHSNTSLDMPFEAYREYVTMKAGFFEVYNTHKGQFFKAKSISFSNMSEDEFEEVYSRVLDVIVEDLGTTEQEIIDNLQSFM